jgi:hypothetical protein
MKKAAVVSHSGLRIGLPVLTVVPLFIFKGSQRISVVSFITFQMPGMFAIWPVDDLFAFFYWFTAGVTFTCEASCDLAGIPGITVKIVHGF